MLSGCSISVSLAGCLFFSSKSTSTSLQPDSEFPILTQLDICLVLQPCTFEIGRRKNFSATCSFFVCFCFCFVLFCFFGMLAQCCTYIIMGTRHSPCVHGAYNLVGEQIHRQAIAMRHFKYHNGENRCATGKTYETSNPSLQGWEPWVKFDFPELKKQNQTKLCELVEIHTFPDL